jgi:hypothetical protein
MHGAKRRRFLSKCLDQRLWFTIQDFFLARWAPGQWFRNLLIGFRHLLVGITQRLTLSSGFLAQVWRCS